VIGTADVSLVAGQTRTVSIPLNRIGRRLLGRGHRLNARLTVAQQGARAAAVRPTTVTFSARVARRHGG
jgi:hypothetical protein